jgi:hypothetical protein
MKIENRSDAGQRKGNATAKVHKLREYIRAGQVLPLIAE